jgi:CCR4-NOT transcription complex subunit 7/8
MLSNSAGIDFQRSLENGIDQNEFGELLISSGLVLLEDVTWITFTGYIAPTEMSDLAAVMTSDTF